MLVAKQQRPWGAAGLAASAADRSPMTLSAAWTVLGRKGTAAGLDAQTSFALQVEQLLGEAASGAQLEYVRKLHLKAQSISQAAAEKIMDPSMTPAELEAAALQLAKQLRDAQAVEEAQGAGAPLQTGSQQGRRKPP